MQISDNIIIPANFFEIIFYRNVFFVICGTFGGAQRRKIRRDRNGRPLSKSKGKAR
jgi:hypothetical protein